jgi:flagellar basal body-associated protein FliL
LPDRLGHYRIIIIIIITIITIIIITIIIIIIIMGRRGMHIGHWRESQKERDNWEDQEVGG